MNSTLQAQLPELLTGQRLKEKLESLPEYDHEIIYKGQGERLLALHTLSDIYISNPMAEEIYFKIYTSVSHVLAKKFSVEHVKQGNINRFSPGFSVLGGADSFTIIGPSGIGKSTAIQRAINLATDGVIIESAHPYAKIIPVLSVQCPHDCSVRSLLFDILSRVDAILGTNYAVSARKSRATVDFLIQSVCQIALSSICLIIIDEVQNVLMHRNGINLINCLTQLINSSGVAICFVGLPESEELLQAGFQLARRTVGLSYGALSYRELQDFCNKLFMYQYVRHPAEVSIDLLDTIYELTGGIRALAVSLFWQAQEVAIISGKEEITPELLREVFHRRMRNISSWLPEKRKRSSSRKSREQIELPLEKVRTDTGVGREIQVQNLIRKARRDQDALVDIFSNEDILLREIEG